MSPPKRVRRKRRRKSVRGRQSQVRAVLFLTLLLIAGFLIGLFGFSSFHKGWYRWRESRLLKQGAEFLRQNNPEAAEAAARSVIALDPKSIAGSRILAEATERQNRSETVAWRAQVAQLAPSLESHLNLASAALRFGQLEVARHALDQIPASEHDKAAYHVVAGWLARAEGNSADEERHFAAAVAREPKNDTYQFNLAVLQILSPDPEKHAAARNTLERLCELSL
jgi:predicted Zn-dependent protease